MKMTAVLRWLKPALVLSLVCSFALTAAAQNYYPSAIGNTWVLMSTDGAERRTYSLEGPENIGGEELIVLKITSETPGTDTETSDKYFVSVEDGAILLHQVATDEGAFGIAEATFEPPVVFFPALLPVGHTWEVVTQTELKLVGPATSTSAIEVVAIEDVETPIGTFEDCVKLEIQGKSVTALAVIRETSYQWLAPDVGPVKYENAQGVVFELESYDLVAEPMVEEPTTPEEPAMPEEPVVEEPMVEEPTTPEEPVEEPTTPEEPVVEEPMVPEVSDYDVTGDGVVNILDLTFVAARFGQVDAAADVNADGTVDILDLTLIAQNFGN